MGEGGDSHTSPANEHHQLKLVSDEASAEADERRCTQATISRCATDWLAQQCFGKYSLLDPQRRSDRTPTNPFRPCSWHRSETLVTQSTPVVVG